MSLDLTISVLSTFGMMMTSALSFALAWFLVQTGNNALLAVESHSGLMGDSVTLDLINTNTMTKVASLVDGSVIGVDSIPGMLTPSFSMHATFAGNGTKFVRFDYNNTINFHIDKNPPFTLCENTAVYKCFALGYGTHSVTVTPYNNQSEPGESTTVTFSLVPTVPSGALRCNIPKLVGSWQHTTSYPLKVGEAQGAMIGTTFLLVSGFYGGFNATTRQTYTLDTINTTAVWTRQDNVPLRNGVTHAAFVAVGAKFYMCGGYSGGTPGPHINRCFFFDLSKPRGLQWTAFASLPDGGRGGGGMVYDSTIGALIFAGGAKRPIASYDATVDVNSTFVFSLHTSNARWTTKAPIPYRGNHISFVTATDDTGKEHHYFVGGQDTRNEANGNKHDHFEYHVPTDTWIRRASMPIARGHASSSTRPIGCGYLIAGGATNGKSKLSDISYYHVPNDTWTSIGNLPKALNTPVCDVANGAWFHCESGLVNRKFSHKIQITT